MSTVQRSKGGYFLLAACVGLRRRHQRLGELDHDLDPLHLL
jgi:hypothetical protein